MSRRARIALAAALGLAAAALLCAAAWFAIAHAIEARAVAWIGEERAAGTRITHRRLAVEGFPSHWTLVAEDYAIARDAPQARSASGPRLEATILPWSLARVPLRAPGVHRLEHDGLALEVEAAHPEATLALRADGRIGELRAELGDVVLRATGMPGAARATRIAFVARDIDPPDRATRDIFLLSLSISDLAPPPGTRPPFDRAGILVAARNFGVGSSREAAVYALLALGIRCVVAESFGDIFFGNALKNGLLPVRLPEAAVTALRAQVLAAPGSELTVDLPRNLLTAPGGIAHDFVIPPFARDCLLRGLDEIGLTQTLLPEIEAFEAARPNGGASVA